VPTLQCIHCAAVYEDANLNRGSNPADEQHMANCCLLAVLKSIQKPKLVPQAVSHYGEDMGVSLDGDSGLLGGGTTGNYATIEWGDDTEPCM
jgi:hypothetical protein